MPARPISQCRKQFTAGNGCGLVSKTILRGFNSHTPCHFMFSSNADVREEAHKRRLQQKCDRCKPHRGENHERKPRRSWKHRSRKGKSYE